MRYPAREPRLSHGPFRHVLHVRHQGDELLVHRRYAGLLPGDSEEMARPPRRAHRRHKDGEERPRTLGHHQSLPERNFLSGVPDAIAKPHGVADRVLAPEPVAEILTAIE